MAKKQYLVSRIPPETRRYEVRRGLRKGRVTLHLDSGAMAFVPDGQFDERLEFCLDYLFGEGALHVKVKEPVQQ